MDTEAIVEAINGLREDMAKSYDGPLTRSQAAEYLQVHPDTVYRWAKDGLIAYSKLGDSEKAEMRFFKEDLDHFAKDRRRIITTSDAKTGCRN